MSATIHQLEPPPGRFDDDDNGETLERGCNGIEVWDENDARASCARLSPTAEEPLRGLDALAAVAVRGLPKLRELAAAPVSYSWQDIAVSGTIVLLAGGPSEGKSTLLALIIVARLTTGIAVWLLERRVTPAPRTKYLVFVQGEHSEASCARMLFGAAKLLGVDEIALDRVIMIARKAVRLGSPEWLDIVRLIAAGHVSDLCVDTIARVAPGDSDDERSQVAIFDQIAQAIEAAKDEKDRPTVWACAHTKKNGTTGDLADVSGSTQRVGQADSVLLVKGEKVDGRTVASRVTFAKLREPPDDYPTPVSFSIVKADNGEKRIVVNDETAADDRPIETRILEAVRVRPMTKMALRTALGRNGPDIEAALTNLFAAREVESTTAQVRGRTHKAIKARDQVSRTSTPDVCPDVDSTRTDTGRHRTDS